MTRNPFGLAKPENTAPQPASTETSPAWLPLIVGVVVGVAFLLGYQRFAPDVIPDDGDRQEQVEPSGTVEAKTKKILIVEETGDSVRFPHVSTLKMQDDYWDQLETRGIYMRPYETDSQDLASELRQAAEGVGLPAILFLGEGDKVIIGKTVPATTQGVDEILGAKL